MGPIAGGFLASLGYDLTFDAAAGMALAALVDFVATAPPRVPRPVRPAPGAG